jgi:hypothetical protein
MFCAGVLEPFVGPFEDLCCDDVVIPTDVMHQRFRRLPFKRLADGFAFAQNVVDGAAPEIDDIPR